MTTRLIPEKIDLPELLRDAVRTLGWHQEYKSVLQKDLEAFALLFEKELDI